MAEMASVFDVSAGYWSKIEGGTASGPSIRMLRSVAVREGVSLDWLQRGEGSGKAFPVQPQQQTVDDLSRVVRVCWMLFRDSKTVDALSALGAVAKGADEDAAIALVRRTMSSTRRPFPTFPTRDALFCAAVIAFDLDLVRLAWY
jgi:transcriptional regulator with XRE-family HTH domain